MHLARRAPSESTFEHMEDAFGSTDVEREQIWSYNENKFEQIGNTILSTSVERKRFWTYRRRALGSTVGAFRSTCVERTWFTHKSRIVFCHWEIVFRSTGAERNVKNTEKWTLLIVTNGLRSTKLSDNVHLELFSLQRTSIWNICTCRCIFSLWLESGEEFGL